MFSPNEGAHMLLVQFEKHQLIFLFHLHLRRIIVMGTYSSKYWSASVQDLSIS